MSERTIPERFQTAEHSYRVVERLRSNSSGSTYEVEREGDGRAFILKELTIAGLSDWKYFDLFEREVETLKAIDHPRIPHWVDSHLDQDSGTFVHVQEKIGGRSLATLVEEAGRVDAERVQDWLRQGLNLLEFLHRRTPPVVHRDITPTNIMIDGDTLYLIDFGAVKVGRQDSTSMTTVGTFGYMAPEQILGRAEPRSDLYGLGMSMISAVTGLGPREFPQDPSTGRIDPSAALHVPPRLRQTLLAMIQPGLGERPSSAGAALRLLDLTAYTPPGAGALVPMGGPPSMDLIGYGNPAAVPEELRLALRQHSLERFPAGLAVLLHFLTFGLFSLIHYGLQHDKLPRARQDDPSGGKAIGFSFIPWFNLYWMIFNPLRLTDRINFQSHLRNKGDVVPKWIVMMASILSVIPYVNILFGIPVWGAAVYALQSGINELADDAAEERKALGPAPKDTDGA